MEDDTSYVMLFTFTFSVCRGTYNRINNLFYCSGNICKKRALRDSYNTGIPDLIQGAHFVCSRLNVR